MPVLERQSDVLHQFRQGDLDAFETLFRLHQSAIYRWIIRIVRDPAAAEDLTLETFWRIYRAHARFDPSRSFETWARRIATNAAFDHMRNARTEIGLNDDLPCTPSPDPGNSEEVRRKLVQAFGRLPPKLRIASTLAQIEEYPYKEIADALGISTAAVKLRVFRSIRILRKELKKQGIEP